MLMSNLLSVRDVRQDRMATRHSPPSDAGDDDSPGVGMAHLTVVPENFERETESDDERPDEP